jgi:hypothetical protein
MRYLTVTREAKKRRIDPDLVRSVVWAENARGGHYGLVGDALGMSRTKLPMNIKPHWARLVGARSEDMTESDTNIAAGTELLKRIMDRVDRPTAAKIGTLWNDSGASSVNDFGAMVARAYQEKPWQNRSRSGPSKGSRSDHR